MPARLLLAGAGHVHLHLLHRAAALRAAGLAPVLISPARFHYSGLAGAVLAGALPESANTVDVAALAAARGVPHLDGLLERVDTAARRAWLADGRWMDFDLASFNLGSVAAAPAALLDAPGVCAVKPLGGLATLRRRLVAEIEARERCPALVVAGGGASAHEVAASLAALARRHGVAPRVALLGPAPGGKDGWAPPAALRTLRRNLAGQGIALVEGRAVARRPGACVLEDGTDLPCDMLVLATGLRAHALVAELGLPVDARGRLRLTSALHSVADPAIFAAGDCAVVEGHPRPMVGVFGVRAAPVLHHNLAVHAAGGKPAAFRPQRRWLAILDLGDGTGLAARGRLWWHGRAALWLKRRLDLGFVRRMRAAGEAQP
ncbi:FAD-dependent oxidoreductase [Teichococcus aestuarii]|uniref:FAD-dependent oxidoreductase n=1 Tax=Teichococcus aestuarii TaxID=568898 RepID=UPI003613A5D4